MRVICVDDEELILKNFEMKVKDFSEITSLRLFLDGKSALEWVENNPVDTAFLDMEMSGMNGIELAKKLKQIDENIRIIFVTAFEQYALDAFGVDALGYVLKPYTKEEIYNELKKAQRMRPIAQKKVEIKTIPRFQILVDGNTLCFARGKTEELLALLVERGTSGLIAGDAIACLWPEKPVDEKAKTLFRVTWKRLIDTLKEAGIDHIIRGESRKKYICKEAVECDLYRILEGEEEAIQSYGGDYLKEYSWAESRTAQLNSIKAGKSGGE